MESDNIIEIAREVFECGGICGASHHSSPIAIRLAEAVIALSAAAEGRSAQTGMESQVLDLPATEDPGPMTDEHTPGSDGLTRTEVYRLLDTYDHSWDGRQKDLLRLIEGYQEQAMASHERMRSAIDRNSAIMSDSFSAVRAQMSSNQQENDAIEKRVARIEIQREEEAKRAVRHGAIAGMATALGLTAIWELLKYKIGWK